MMGKKQHYGSLQTTGVTSWLMLMTLLLMTCLVMTTSVKIARNSTTANSTTSTTQTPTTSTSLTSQPSSSTTSTTSTTSSTAESTTELPTESTAESTTELPTESTTESTTEPTTEARTEAVTDITTQTMTNTTTETTTEAMAMETTAEAMTYTMTGADSTSSADFSSTVTSPSAVVSCTPSSVSVEMPEFASPGTCLATRGRNPLICTPSPATSPSLSWNLTVLGGSLGERFNLTSSQVPDTPGSVIDLCVGAPSAAFPPGNFQLTLQVSYQTGQTSGLTTVAVNLTVNDDNEAPEVVVASVIYTVPENAPVGSAILNFTVRDPDARSANGNPAFRNITGVFWDPADNSSTQTYLRIEDLGNGSSFEVTVGQRLNASLIDSFAASIAVSDGGGIMTVRTVYINVTDVNEAPQCSSDNVTVVVTPVTSVGSVVGRVECWDWDRTLEFREIVFTPSVLGGSLVSIDNNGTITLTNPVTVDTVAMEMVVRVHAPGFPEPSTNVSVSLDIQFTPPTCIVTQSTPVLPDTAQAGTCSNNTVQCSTAGSDAVLQVTLGSTEALRWTVVEGNVTSDADLVFDICVTKPLYHSVGRHVLDLRVSNSTGETVVSVLLNITDINQAPRFLKSSQSPIYLPENTSPQTSVAEVRVISSRDDVIEDLVGVVYVWDPDNVTESFKFRNVTFVDAVATFPSQTTVIYPDSSQSPIYLQATGNPPYTFFARGSVLPGSNISVTIQATDYEGLNTTTSVLFVIDDVTQPPVCLNTSINVTLSLVTSVNTSLLTLQCYGSSALNYTELPDSGYDYFMVNETGDVILEERVPINVTVMSYTVLVSDEDGLSTNVVINFLIYRNYPPQCTVNDITLTETFQGAQCQNTTLTCSEVAGLGSYGLTWKASWSYDFGSLEVSVGPYWRVAKWLRRLPEGSWFPPS